MILTVCSPGGIVMASDRFRKGASYAYPGPLSGRENLFLCPNGAGISVNGEGIAGQEEPKSAFWHMDAEIRRMIQTHIHKDSAIEEIPRRILDCFSGSVSADTVFHVGGYGSVPAEPFLFEVRPAENHVVRLCFNLLTERLYAGYFFSGGNDIAPRLYAPGGAACEQFTLQDSVDFARFSFEVERQIRRFQTAGPPISETVDILAFTPEASRWIQKQTVS